MMMEPWELELEFWTWDAYERALAKAQGRETVVEEFETDDEDFKAMVEQFNREAGIPDEFDPAQWEEVDG